MSCVHLIIPLFHVSVCVGLTRLQDTYRLDSRALAAGILGGRFYGPVLRAHDCFEIGRQSYNNGDYFHTNVWMEEALRQLDNEEEKTIKKVIMIKSVKHIKDNHLPSLSIIIFFLGKQNTA